MANRTRKPQTKTAQLKARPARSVRGAAPNTAKLASLPSNAICLASYRSSHAALPQRAVGDGLQCARPLPSDHTAQIMFFTGVQIVRKARGDTSND